MVGAGGVGIGNGVGIGGGGVTNLGDRGRGINAMDLYRDLFEGLDLSGLPMLPQVPAPPSVPAPPQAPNPLEIFGIDLPTGGPFSRDWLQQQAWRLAQRQMRGEPLFPGDAPTMQEQFLGMLGRTPPQQAPSANTMFGDMFRDLRGR